MKLRKGRISTTSNSYTKKSRSFASVFKTQKHKHKQKNRMTPFIIFFVIVTILYAVYYAVLITLDLRQKEKSEAKAEEENFDVSDIASQAPESVSVRTVEGGEGFQVGEQEPQMISQDVNAYGGLDEQDDDQQRYPTDAEQHAESCRNCMEEIQPMDNDEKSYADGSIQEYLTKEQYAQFNIKETPVIDNA